MSPELVGRLPTIGPPGKSLSSVFWTVLSIIPWLPSHLSLLLFPNTLNFSDQSPSSFRTQLNQTGEILGLFFETTFRHCWRQQNLKNEKKKKNLQQRFSTALRLSTQKTSFLHSLTLGTVKPMAGNPYSSWWSFLPAHSRLLLLHSTHKRVHSQSINSWVLIRGWTVNLCTEESYIILIYFVSEFQVASSENSGSKVWSKNSSESHKFLSLGNKVCLHLYLFLYKCLSLDSRFLVSRHQISLYIMY